MKYKEMKYWNKWHEIMSNEEAKATCAKCNRTYDVRKGCGCS